MVILSNLTIETPRKVSTFLVNIVTLVYIQKQIFGQMSLSISLLPLTLRAVKSLGKARQCQALSSLSQKPEIIMFLV